MVYVGKLTATYMDREMVEFFAVARSQDPRLAFVVLTQAPPESIRAELARAGIPEADFRIARAEPEAMGSYLGMADFAICLCRPSLARIASSPTKVGEYLAAGLPVASGPRIGDLDNLLGGGDVGVVLDEFSARSYERASMEIRALASDPGSRARCRAVARETFSLEEVGIPRYDQLYRRLAGVCEDPRSSPARRPVGDAEST
jgi:glycosyltransferase involved in cell wall biosynthesis